MRKTKVEKTASGANRQPDGRFRKGHKCGGRASRSGALTEAFMDAGVSVAEARRLVIQQTIKNARAGTDSAVERLARLVLPASRPTPNVFKGAASASERAEAVVAAVETGALTVQEAAMLAQGALRHLAEAQEWKDVAERLDKLATSAPAEPRPLRVVHVDAALPAAPTAVDAAFEPSDHE